MTSESFLPEQQAELDRLGFKTLKTEPGTLVMASGKFFYWDCILTFMNYTVFVRQVEVLSAAVMESDRTRFQALAQAENPSFLPRGMQSGNAVLSVYIANTVDTDAQQICQKPRSISGFAKFYLAGALDTTTGQQYYSTKSPMVGAVYYGKFRYLIQRLLDPQNAPAKRPTSMLGVGLLVVLTLMIIFPVFVALLFVVLG
ncbi:MAG: hypothetical protein AAFY33_15405 [Cyanobacteria bacterium J06643_4]